MFTGLIEQTAPCLALARQGHDGTITVANPFGQELRLGDSIAVNGVCLTVEKFSADRLQFHALAETFSRTNLGQLRHGSLLNLERALKLGDRLGGHLVSGHIDTTVPVLDCRTCQEDIQLTCRRPDHQLLLVPKGSVTLNGVSLTIASLTDDSFTVCLIPHTWKNTNLCHLNPGDLVNLETDMLGKYVQACLQPENAAPSHPITMDTLVQAGFLN